MSKRKRPVGQPGTKEVCGVCGKHAFNEIEQRCTRCGSTLDEVLLAQGADSGNTAPTNSTGGLDWLSLSLYGWWRPEDHEQLCERLAIAQGWAQMDDERRFIDVAGVTCEVMRQGGGSGFSYTPFVMKANGCVFRISDRRTSHCGKEAPERPVAYVEITGMVFLQNGDRGAIEKALGVLAATGFKQKRACPSRVDLAVDLPGEKVRDFVDAFNESRIICKAKEFRIQGRRGKTINPQTLYVGAGDRFLMRVYDKIAETQHDEEKRELLRLRRWGGEIPEHATRVEFQIRREGLREQFGIETLEQLLDNLQTISEWFTLRWCRFTESSVDRSNTTRQQVAPFWARVRTRFLRWTKKAKGARLKPVKLHVEPKQLVAQALGCMQAAFARQGKKIESALDIGNAFFDWVHHQASEFIIKTRAKRVAFLAGVPGLDLATGKGMVPVGT